MILHRIEPIIDEKIPKTQAGLRKNTNCTEQVMVLTYFIETGFQKNLKTGVAYVDLLAAYNTVWRHGLLLKLVEVIPCAKMITLIDSMLSYRFLTMSLEL